MKLKNSVGLLAVAFLISFGAVGCKKGIQKVTPLPVGQTGASPQVGGPGDASPLGPASDPNSQNIPLSSTDYTGWIEDRTIFSGQTVYFDFDQSNVRPGELQKLETVASRMQAFPGRALKVEGHCDERGTEGYNQALGDKRAASVREALAKMGLDPRRITTTSFGEDRPADPGHSPAAWAKNRRAELILLTPPSGAGATSP